MCNMKVKGWKKWGITETNEPDENQSSVEETGLAASIAQH